MSVQSTVSKHCREEKERILKSYWEMVCNSLECCFNYKSILNFSKRFFFFYDLFHYFVAVFSSLSSPVDSFKNKIASGKKLWSCYIDLTWMCVLLFCFLKGSRPRKGEGYSSNTSTLNENLFLCHKLIFFF